MDKKQKPPNSPRKEKLGGSDKPLNSNSEVLYDKNVDVATSKAIVNKQMLDLLTMAMEL